MQSAVSFVECEINVRHGQVCSENVTLLFFFLPEKMKSQLLPTLTVKDRGLNFGMWASFRLRNIALNFFWWVAVCF